MAAPLPPQDIDLVDKEDGALLALALGQGAALLEYLPDPLRPYSGVHFNKFAAGNADEGGTGIARRCFSQEGFPRPRRADQHDPLQGPDAHGLQLPGLEDEIQGLQQFFFSRFLTANLVEVHLRLAFQALAAGYPHPRHFRPGKAEKEDEQSRQEHHRQKVAVEPQKYYRCRHSQPEADIAQD